jgi:Holliday junction resolvase RusA-like endonuclease
MRNGRAVVGQSGRPVIKHYTDERTEAYESIIRLAAAQAMGGRAPFDGPLAARVECWFPIPPSWSKKKQAQAAAGAVKPTKKPDLDNILKAIWDGCNEVVYLDDVQVVQLATRKDFTADAPRVEVTFSLIEGTRC